LAFACTIAVDIYIAVILKSPVLGTVGFVLICTMPFLFQKSVKELFTKDTILKFDDDSFLVIMYRQKDEARRKSVSYRWSDIKAYKFYFTISNLTCLDIYLRNGKRAEFQFKDNMGQEESIKVGNHSIFNVFRSFIREYNNGKPENEKIELKPPFLTTKRGMFWLVLVGILVIVAIITLVITNSKSFGFLFMGMFAFLPLLAKRRNDKLLFQRISDLN
jgi:hypothetical protein